jgi:hypothetical protein
MCLYPLVGVLILEIDAEEKGSARKGHCVGEFTNNMVKLDP